MADSIDQEPENSDQQSSSLAATVAQIRKAAAHQHRGILRMLVFSIAAALIVSAAVWFLQSPRDRDEVHFGLASGMGLATLLAGVLFSRMIFPGIRAECPRCGCDWNAQSDGDTRTWIVWNSCPGCGLRISDEGHSPQRSDSTFSPTDPSRR